jgi:tRNA C32,U32 (ribose-2'-O)-methylase TrmJ
LFLICGLAVAANGLLGEGAILAGHSKWARQAESKIPNSRPNKEEVMNKRQLERMETQIKELRTTLKSLAEDKVFDELSRIIRRPGFTRPAEAAFLVGLLDSMLGQAKNMSRLKQVVLAGAEKVELNPQPLPP